MDRHRLLMVMVTIAAINSLVALVPWLIGLLGDSESRRYGVPALMLLGAAALLAMVLVALRRPGPARSAAAGGDDDDNDGRAGEGD